MVAGCDGAGPDSGPRLRLPLLVRRPSSPLAYLPCRSSPHVGGLYFSVPRSSCSSSSSLLPLVLFPVVSLLPVVFIPTRRNEHLPRRDARGPAPAGMRSRASGSARFLVTGGPCAGVRQSGSRRRRGREPAPGRRALAGPAPCAETGICSRKRTNVWPAGCWGSSPGRLTYSLPCRSPPRGPCSFPRRFREARWNRRPRAGVLLCRTARRRTAAPGPAPPLVREISPEAAPVLTPTTTSTEGVTWICARCSVPWTRTSIDLARACAAFVAGHGPQVVAERRARAGCRPARDRRRAPGAAASVSDSGDGARISRSSSARPNSWRHTARPGRYREPSLETSRGRSTLLFLNRPVAGRRCRTGALGAVAGTADANACVRGAGSCACLLRAGCLSLFSAARLSLPWFVCVPRRFREARQTGGHGRC